MRNQLQQVEVYVNLSQNKEKMPRLFPGIFSLLNCYTPSAFIKVGRVTGLETLRF